ncbi:hypothetical protein KV557_20010 [Kitasatospora aureofaciens]|uniref:SecDF P1 head subdomain-containing protein n=1 Tax=Kitasatospora aureofaciens TaxID=1894 RepID=UPI001C4587CB|nr:hypothetical protein [Kitasatospora aureofaciens]MBV6699381.1 hypothetical protein [Kitasatospora aureofaciens]
MRSTRGGLAVLLVSMVLLTGCSGQGGGSPAAPAPPTLATGSAARAVATFTPKRAASPGELQETAGQLQKRAAALEMAGVQVEVSGGSITASAVGGTREQFAALAEQGQLGFRPVLALAPSGVGGSAPVQGAAPAAGPAAAFGALDCGDPAQRTDRQSAPEAEAVACSHAEQQGVWFKFVLGPVAVDGKDVSAARAVLDDRNGAGWQVDLSFDAAGAKAFADVTGRLAAQVPPGNEFAIVVDGAVVSHPYVASAITGGAAVISGSFTADEARKLAAQISNRLTVALTLTDTTTP